MSKSVISDVQKEQNIFFFSSFLLVIFVLTTLSCLLDHSRKLPTMIFAGLTTLNFVFELMCVVDIIDTRAKQIK